MASMSSPRRHLVARLAHVNRNVLATTGDLGVSIAEGHAPNVMDQLAMSAATVLEEQARQIRMAVLRAQVADEYEPQNAEGED